MPNCSAIHRKCPSTIGLGEKLARRRSFDQDRLPLNNDHLTDPTISVVVPVYGCVNCLEELCDQLATSLRTLTDHFEIILVDDRSPDSAWPKIVSLQALYPSIKGIRLSRNYG